MNAPFGRERCVPQPSRPNSSLDISIHIPGEFVDLQNFLLEESDHNVQSLGRSEVAIIPKQALGDLVAAREQVACPLWRETLIDASIFREWVVNVGRRSAAARIAHLLCELALRLRAAGLCPANSCDFPSPRSSSPMRPA
jgi:CRP-like cAMP-binding protein